MTRRKKTEVDTFVNDWMARIKSGVDYRKRFSSFDHWDDYKKMYRGQWAEGVKPVNKVFSYGRSLVPRVYFRSPRVSVTATKPDLVWHAKVVEEIDNQLIREALLKYTLKRSALDGYLCGTGPIKIGYDSEYGYMPEQATGEDASTVTQVGRKTGEAVEYRTGVRPGMPWAIRVSPDDVVVPWGSGEASTLPWIAHYILRPLEDIKEDQKYQHTEDLQGTRSPDRGSRGRPEFRPRRERDKDIAYGELWEVKDWKTKQIMVFCEDKMIMSTKDVLQIEGLPWEFIQWNPDPDYFWGVSDVTILEPDQYELNEVRTQQSRHRAIALLKFLYKKGVVSKEALEEFFSGKIGPGIEVDDENIVAAIVTLQPHMPPELWREAQMILQNMRETLGVATHAEAMFKAGTPPSAKESGMVEESYDVRTDERKDIVADVLVNIVRKWNQFIFNFWTEQRVVEIVSPQGTPFWIQYTGDELKGEYTLQVDPESGMPFTSALKYQMGREIFGELDGDPLVDQVILRQIRLNQYKSVEPLAAKLIRSPSTIDPRMAAMIRSPHPRGMAGAGGVGRGRGTSPMRPAALEQLQKGR